MTVSIVLGLEAQECQDLFGLLQATGVSKALAGKVHGLAPDAITAAVLKDLRKRAKAVPLKAAPKAKGRAVAAKPAPKAGRFLSDVASDLFLANIDADAWGWIEPNGFEGLGFWSDFDDAVRFLIVYTSPEAHFLDAMAREPIEPLDPRAEMKSWMVFHRAAVEFAGRHPGRCLFVNAENLRRRPAEVVDALKNMGVVHSEGADMKPFASRAHSDAGLLASLLARQALAEVTDTAGLYDELEPLEVLGGYPEAPAPVTDELVTELRTQSLGLRGLRQKLEALQAERAAAGGEVATLKQQLANAQAESKQKLDALQVEKAASGAEIATLKQQLAKAQAEAKQKLDALQAETTKLQRDLTELNKKQEAAGNAKELKEENELLLVQLHQAQEELQHYNLEAEKLLEARMRRGPEELHNSALFDYWNNNQPNEIWLDLRKSFVGENWHDAEAGGRWSGPGVNSSIQLPPLGAGRYTGELELMDAMAPSLVDTAALAVSGSPCPVHVSRLSEDASYPMVLRFEFSVTDGAEPTDAALSLKLESTVSPAESGSDDARFLGIYVRSLLLLRQA